MFTQHLLCAKPCFDHVASAVNNIKTCPHGVYDLQRGDAFREKNKALYMVQDRDLSLTDLFICFSNHEVGMLTLSQDCLWTVRKLCRFQNGMHEPHCSGMLLFTLWAQGPGWSYCLAQVSNKDTR